jgi:predicted  nucleic acid-binding Zn-ribbon protein
MIARREIPAETRAQQNIFISMTDLTVSALLVIVILMAFMATQMRDTRSLKKLTDLRSQLNATQSAFSELQAENVEQGQLINQLSQDLSAEVDIRTELDETIKKLEQSVVQRSVEISRLDLELRAALQTVGLAQSRLLASQAARAADQEKAETELEFARQRGEALTKRIEEYEKNNKNLGATLAKVNTKYQDLQNEFDRQIAAAERTKLELEVKIEDLQARTLELTDNLEKSAERLAAGERTLAAEKLRLDNSRAELAAVRNSLSIELKTSRELNKDHAQTKILLNSSQSEIELLNKKILELAELLDAEKASKIYVADLSSEIEGLNKKLLGERLKLQVSEGQSKTLNGIVDELRGALVKEQKKVAGLEQLLGDAQADLDAKKLGFAQRDREISQLRAELINEQSNYSEKLEDLGNQIARLELDIAAAEQKSKISNNQATALVGITNELRAALKAAQGTANTLRDNAAQFDRQLASALSIDTPDRQIIMERISVLAQDEPSTSPNPENLRTELAGAMLEVEMLSKQNANLKATIQTLLANSSKIIERLRNK